MGYILPIRLHAYEQYQYRVIGEEGPAYYLHQVYPVAFRTSPQGQLVTKENETKWRQAEKGVQISSGQERAFYLAEAQQVALTGKGEHINVRI